MRTRTIWIVLLIPALFAGACSAPLQTGLEERSSEANPAQPPAFGMENEARVEADSTHAGQPVENSPRNSDGTQTDQPGGANSAALNGTGAEDRAAGQPNEADTGAQIGPQFHMTKNFFIKPNDESADSQIVLLTFDDGPKDEAMLGQILDTLDKYGAKAIFFVNGFRVKQNPHLLKLIHERGQVIGNHSWDHINLKHEPDDVVAAQIGDVQDIVTELTGEAPRFFRPPNGAGSDAVRAVVKEHGMLYMTWSNGSLDWADNRNHPEGVVATVLDQLLPGSNILMHELQWTADALDTLLLRIGEEGYSFVDPRLIETEAR